MIAATRALRPWILGLGLAAAAACNAEAAAVAQPEAPAAASDQQAPKAARQTVVALFEAFQAADCKAIGGLLGGALRTRMASKPCADFLANEPLRTVEVTHIGEARVDGRDPRSFFVTVSLVEAGRERPVVVRVNQRDDGHRVVSM